jgi:hypothetical protein
MIKKALLMFAACAGCGLDDGITDTQCGQAMDMPSVTVAASETPTFTTGTESVKVRGTAQHRLGLAIRRVTVDGLDATSGSFNFSAWSLDVPGDVISMRVSSLPTTVMLPVVAYDTCSGETAAATATATVNVVNP